MASSIRVSGFWIDRGAVLRLPAPILFAMQADRLRYCSKGEFMDLRMFFHKVRKLEQEIADPHVVLVSLETPDGGKPGIRTEVSRENASRMIVDGRARLASKGEAAEYCRTCRPEPRPEPNW